MKWISDIMRRRSRRGPNESESTGKSGQELPAGQLAPLRPTYPEPARPVSPGAETIAASETIAAPETAREQESEAAKAAGFEPANAEDKQQKVVVETQPESVATPPAEMTAVPAKS